jgi:hypothetical protein
MSDAAPAVDVPAAPPATGAQPDGTAPAGEAPKPERTFSQAELDAAIEKRLAKERRKRSELETRLKVTEELALKGKPEPKPEQKPSDGEPVRDDFPTYEAYLEARADWRADRKVEERFLKQREEEARARTEAGAQKMGAEFRAKAEKFASTVEDFHEVMSESDAPMTKAMAEAIVGAEDAGPGIAYYLAKNVQEAERIASLPEKQQAREIWKLEQTLGKPTKTPSKAPPPIDPVKGKATVADDGEPDPSDTKKWVEWRNKQVAKKARG